VLGHDPPLVAQGYIDDEKAFRVSRGHAGHRANPRRLRPTTGSTHRQSQGFLPDRRPTNPRVPAEEAARRAAALAHFLTFQEAGEIELTPRVVGALAQRKPGLPVTQLMVTLPAHVSRWQRSLSA
jgi:hypothetical protein